MLYSITTSYQINNASLFSVLSSFGVVLTFLVKSFRLKFFGVPLYKMVMAPAERAARRTEIMVFFIVVALFSNICADIVPFFIDITI